MNEKCGGNVLSEVGYALLADEIDILFFNNPGLLDASLQADNNNVVSLLDACHRQKVASFFNSWSTCLCLCAHVYVYLCLWCVCVITR